MRVAHEDPDIVALLRAPASRQAALLARWGLPELALLMLDSPCDNRCVFCANAGVTDTPLGAVDLDFVRASRSPLLAIGGNEPASHPGLERVLEASEAPRVQVMTSGLRLLGDARSWAARGVTEVAVPLYGLATVHDALVANDAFERTWRGLEAAHDAGLTVRVHSLALRANRDQLPALARAVRERFGTRLALGPARDKEVWSYAQGALPWSELPDADLELVGFPPCVRPELPRGGAEVIQIYFACQAKGFVPACAGCRARPTCRGVVQAELDRGLALVAL